MNSLKKLQIQWKKKQGPIPDNISLSMLSVFSLVLTPLLIFISTTVTLYIKNQSTLSHQIDVLFPFLIFFLILLCIGISFLILCKLTKTGIFKLFLYGYYLLGPFFFVYSVFHNKFPSILNHYSICIIIIFFFLYLLFIFYKKGSIHNLQKVLVSICLVLLISESVLFFTGMESISALECTFNESEKKIFKKDKIRPNIYHIVFDEYQTDMFELTLSAKIKEELYDFILFPENTTVYGRTRMALASTFLGKPYDYETSQIEYQMSGYNSRESFLYWLVKEGYRADALIHPILKYDMGLFHCIKSHANYADSGIVKDKKHLFQHLWLFSYFPEIISRRYINPEDLNQLKNQNLLPDEAPVLSYYNFQKFLIDEKRMSSSNHYVFIHLILPHFPNVLDAECQCGKPLANGDLPVTSVLEQSKCATRMILDFVDRLKKLNRYDDSMIIIHSDHGSRYKVENNKLINIEKLGVYSTEWSTARSRALLLMKFPSNKENRHKFCRLDYKTTLLNIAPTILEAVGVHPDTVTPEPSLTKPVPQNYNEKRYYHFYSKKGWHGWTDKMVRFVIKDNIISREKTIKLKDTPPEKGVKINFPWLNR